MCIKVCLCWTVAVFFSQWFSWVKYTWIWGNWRLCQIFVSKESEKIVASQQKNTHNNISCPSITHQNFANYHVSSLFRSKQSFWCEMVIIRTQFHEKKKRNLLMCSVLWKYHQQRFWRAPHEHFFLNNLLRKFIFTKGCSYFCKKMCSFCLFRWLESGAKSA